MSKLEKPELRSSPSKTIPPVLNISSSSKIERPVTWMDVLAVKEAEFVPLPPVMWREVTHDPYAFTPKTSPKGIYFFWFSQHRSCCIDIFFFLEKEPQKEPKEKHGRSRDDFVDLGIIRMPASMRKRSSPVCHAISCFSYHFISNGSYFLICVL